jgi:hypothetical protein
MTISLISKIYYCCSSLFSFIGIKPTLTDALETKLQWCVGERAILGKNSLSRVQLRAHGVQGRPSQAGLAPRPNGGRTQPGL